MPLLDEQFEYRGLIMGPGTDYHVNQAEGFEGFSVRSSDSDQPRGDGALRGLDYVAPRLLSFELAVIETAENGGVDYEALWDAVRAAFVPSLDTDHPLTFKRPGRPERLIRCRPIQLLRNEEYGRFNRVGFPPVVLRAVDPRIYSTEEHTGGATVYSPIVGGTETPLDFGIDFSGGLQNELVVHNSGTADSYPLIRFYGPTTGTCTGVSLTNTTTGAVLDIDTTVTTGQILTADMDAAVTGANRMVVSLDGSSRYGSWQLPRAAFGLQPGSNTLRFEVTGTTTDMVCVITHRDTWLS